MKLDVHQALQRLQTEGTVFSTLFKHGSLEVEIYKPAKADLQQPHSRDELYVVATGTATFRSGDEQWDVAPGDVLFVPALREHRFIRFSEDFSTWVMFYGPEGGEAARTGA